MRSGYSISLFENCEEVFMKRDVYMKILLLTETVYADEGEFQPIICHNERKLFQQAWKNKICSCSLVNVDKK